MSVVPVAFSIAAAVRSVGEGVSPAKAAGAAPRASAAALMVAAMVLAMRRRWFMKTLRRQMRKPLTPSGGICRGQEISSLAYAARRLKG